MDTKHLKILEFWEKIFPEIELYVKKNVPQDDVEEVLQEVLLVVLRKFHKSMRLKNGSYKSNHDFKLWTYRISTNKILNLRKRNKRDSHLDISMLIDKIPSDDQVEDTINKLMVQQILSQLDQSDLTLLQLRANALSYREIAQVMQKSETALTSQLYRLKRKFKNNLMSM